MSNIFWKNFPHCFSKSLKYDPSLTPPPTPTPSPPPPPPSSKQDTQKTTIKISNSLYDFSSELSTSKSLTTLSSSTSSDADSDAASPPDFATIFASQRFFFSSPGRSNSIIESPDSTTILDYQETTVNGGVAVKKYSPDPYIDFRSSMQEMIEARNLKDVMADWDFLHELLLCYLTLNAKHTHKFIISAFADILITLLSSPPSRT